MSYFKGLGVVDAAEKNSRLQQRRGIILRRMKRKVMAIGKTLSKRVSFSPP